MNMIRLISFCILLHICICSFVDIFDEWSKKTPEPQNGNGPYEFRLVHFESCNAGHKRDPTIWIDNITMSVEKNKLDLRVDSYVTDDVPCSKINYELWGKINNKIALLHKGRTVINPCKNIMSHLFFQKLNVTPPCTILKGHYYFTFEDYDKMVHGWLKHAIYGRYIAKAEVFTYKGQFSCGLIILDFVKRI